MHDCLSLQAFFQGTRVQSSRFSSIQAFSLPQPYSKVSSSTNSSQPRWIPQARVCLFHPPSLITSQDWVLRQASSQSAFDLKTEANKGDIVKIGGGLSIKVETETMTTYETITKDNQTPKATSTVTTTSILFKSKSQTRYFTFNFRKTQANLVTPGPGNAVPRSPPVHGRTRHIEIPDEVDSAEPVANPQNAIAEKVQSAEYQARRSSAFALGQSAVEGSGIARSSSIGGKKAYGLTRNEEAHLPTTDEAWN